MRGQAVIVAVIILSLLAVIVIGNLTGLIVRATRVEQEFARAVVGFYAAESGLEDAAYRISHNLTYAPVYTLVVGEAATEVAIAASGHDREIESRGDFVSRVRKLRSTLRLTSTEVRFHYGVQVSDGGLTLDNTSSVIGNVYSNGNVVGYNNSLITGDVVVAGGINPDPSLEWTVHDGDQVFAALSSNRDITQSFVAPISDPLVRLSVYLGKVGSPSGNITVRLARDSGDKPQTSSIATAVIMPAAVGVTPSWIDVSFVSPPSLIADSKYWIVLDYNSSSASNHWIWRKDSTDGYAGNTGKYTGSCCSGSPVWTPVGGDLAFRIWQGGVNTRIDGLTIGDAETGTGRANLFVNTTIRGAPCPNLYCIVSNPPRQELPISEGVVQDWRDTAAQGGVCGPPVCSASGDFSLDNFESASLGPIHIPGSLSVNNGANLTVTGTLWVSGAVSFNNNSVIQLDPGYGANSGLILTDQTVAVNNNVEFLGSGQPGSQVMMLSAKNNPAGVVMDINNNAVGVIYYAGNGRIQFNNNARAKEATAYGIQLDNGATIIYESGLASTFFSTGPGASFSIDGWREI